MMTPVKAELGDEVSAMVVCVCVCVWRASAVDQKSSLERGKEGRYPVCLSRRTRQTASPPRASDAKSYRSVLSMPWVVVVVMSLRGEASGLTASSLELTAVVRFAEHWDEAG